jgi:hypothetical protein
MATSIHPTLPVIAASSATGASYDAVLVPGTVVNAEVLEVAERQVRIAIAGLAIDVLSEVPLKVGESLQLAVSQMEDGGVRLSIGGQGIGSAGAAVAESMTPAPDTQAAANPSAAPIPRAYDDPLNPSQRVAVSVAAEAAAIRQQGLGPLFANLAIAAASNRLPPALQQAIALVLAQRISLDQALAGQDIQDAFRKSGLFLEASLASASSEPASALPDLKAALIVLRQTLGSMVDIADAPPAALARVATPVAQAGTASTPASDASARSLAPEIGGRQRIPDVVLPEGQLAQRQDGVPASPKLLLSEALLDVESGAATTATVLNLVQEALQGIPRSTVQAATSMTLPDGRREDVTLRSLTPPPPFRGALPSAQPIAAATIAEGAPLPTIVHRLLDGTNGALARQSLLQIASLPVANDPSHVHGDPSTPRWSFEIPFATPQGTAMAQFEITRDGGGGADVEPASKVWRARFSLDIEPAGPVHALVTFTGECTSVRMWAERPQTAAWLHAGRFELTEALARAELSPGDIVIREGAPPQAALAKAGHFLDRAS